MTSLPIQMGIIQMLVLVAAVMEMAMFNTTVRMVMVICR